MFRDVVYHEGVIRALEKRIRELESTLDDCMEITCDAEMKYRTLTRNVTAYSNMLSDFRIIPEGSELYPCHSCGLLVRMENLIQTSSSEDRVCTLCMHSEELQEA